MRNTFGKKYVRFVFFKKKYDSLTEIMTTKNIENVYGIYIAEMPKWTISLKKFALSRDSALPETFITLGTILGDH